MRMSILLAATFIAICSAPGAGWAQGTCKECSDQQKRCMSNYAGPTCKTEYDRCMKNCKK
jgi:hypothetical protein